MLFFPQFESRCGSGPLEAGIQRARGNEWTPFVLIRPFQNKQGWSSSTLARVQPHAQASVSWEELSKSTMFMHVRLLEPAKRVRGASFLSPLPCQVGPRRVPATLPEP